ncbi:MAG: 3-oxoacyl-ACP synthase III family protein [Chitinophagales bacterium]
MELNGLAINDLMDVEITATGSAFPLPGRFVDNSEIHHLKYGENWEAVFHEKNHHPEYIFQQLGYKKRYWTHTPGTPLQHNELTSADLMQEAAHNCLTNAGMDLKSIDLFIAVTVTSPKYTNSMGAFVGGKLGLKCPAIEIKTGCASSVYALVLAAQFIKSGARNVLIASGETPTKVTGIETNLMYAVGDGGAAAILSKSENNNKGIISAFLGTEGEYSGTMGSPGLLPPNRDDLDNDAYNMLMGKESDAFIQNAWKGIPNILYHNSGTTSSDIDLFIPQQVNKKIINLVKEASGISENKTIDLISEYANCGSASVLIAMDHAMKNKRLKENDLIMIASVGGGVSYGGLIFKL